MLKPCIMNASKQKIFLVIAAVLVIVSFTNVIADQALSFLVEMSEAALASLAVVTGIKIAASAGGSSMVPVVSGTFKGAVDLLDKAFDYLALSNGLIIFQIILVNLTKSWLVKSLGVVAFALIFVSATKKYAIKALIVLLCVNPGLPIYVVTIQYLAKEAQLHVAPSLKANLQKVKSEFEEKEKARKEHWQQQQPAPLQGKKDEHTEKMKSKAERHTEKKQRKEQKKNPDRSQNSPANATGDPADKVSAPTKEQSQPHKKEGFLKREKEKRQQRKEERQEKKEEKQEHKKNPIKQVLEANAGDSGAAKPAVKHEGFLKRIGEDLGNVAHKVEDVATLGLKESYEYLKAAMERMVQAIINFLVITLVLYLVLPFLYFYGMNLLMIKLFGKSLGTLVSEGEQSAQQFVKDSAQVVPGSSSSKDQTSA